MEKRVNWIISLVSILLIIAAIVGMIFMVRGIDETFTEETETTTDVIGNENTGSLTTESVNNPSNNNSNNTPGNSVETTPSASADYYIDAVNKTGYSTVAGTTYFFKVVYPISGKNHLTVDYGEMYSYDGYEVVPLVSHDLISWTDYPSWYRYDGENLAQCVVRNEGTYVCYTTVSGCSNPKLVLEDLNQHIFCEPGAFPYGLDVAFG